ncbi:MAG: NTP transferase domain-containing protein [Desulforhopalus sp.]|nr:NTP transferase domain-containing protein [Desulforhopalus sp.]
MKLSAVILAAGYSSRMNGFKPLMELGGRSLLYRCAELFNRAGVKKVAVVTGHRHAEVAEEAKRCGLTCLHNSGFDQGMYSSVRLAAGHFLRVDGLFILPVDIPLVRSATIAALLAAFDGKTLVTPTFAGKAGHPPLLPGRLLKRILTYEGRGGLRALLEKEPGREIAVWDRGILLDADTAEDFAALAARFDLLAQGEREEAMELARLVMPEKGVAHGLAVAEVATILARALNRHGLDLDEQLVYNAALLHDLAKGQAQHEIRGAAMLNRLGLDRLAPLVAGHRDIPPPSTGHLGEKEVVCLADKLVRGSRRVPIEQRFAEKLELYATDRDACRAINGRRQNALALQEMVEQHIGRPLEEILANDLGC